MRCAACCVLLNSGANIVRRPGAAWRAALLLACALGTAAESIGAAPAASADAPDIQTVYAVGDIARCKHPDPRWSGAADTAAVVGAGLAADPQAVVLTLGDHTYPRGTAAEFAGCYDPTWGRFKERTWPSPGNHEYYTKDAAPYFAYFGERAGRGYYSLRLGQWRIYSLDSNLKGAAQARQLAWLKDELAHEPAAGAVAPCTLAFWHHPLYSSGGHGSVPTMRAAWVLLQQAGAELVLSGHDHDYERFAPQDAHGNADLRGLRQFVVGTGGAYPTPFLRWRANSETRDASRNGVLRLRLYAGGYDWEFLEATPPQLPNASPPDRGSARCH
ncbi:metallophosphoesterase [Massilia sp. CFBP 13647]|nr:metallophosphoesterase [Massilia sp. CFBP 13647]MBD8676220.1 metallophosphoesterase [Massilia sp. CFBP 13721]